MDYKLTFWLNSPVTPHNMLPALNLLELAHFAIVTNITITSEPCLSYPHNAWKFIVLIRLLSQISKCFLATK